MTLLAAILLAIFVLPPPWGIVAVVAAGIWETFQTFATIRWSQRRQARVGAEALVGRTARVVERCDPAGKAAVGGEVWNARCEGGADVGETVRVRAVQGLTLVVARDQETVSAPESHQST